MGYLKIGKYYGPNPSASIYQFKETLDADYLDISCVEYWFKIGEEAGKDFLYQRAGAMGYIEYSQSFDELSEYDKPYAAQNFCVDKDDRDTLYTDAEQEIYWKSYIENSQTARETRWNNAKSYISYRLSKTDSNDTAQDTLLLNEKYIYYGIESSSIDNVDGLYDYINGTSEYASTGFPSKTYYTSDLKDGVTNCLNGLT
tara:strand:+ start:29 stop:628 length:600 start_codon:yes stop_codon:yes gene_type:complete